MDGAVNPSGISSPTPDVGRGATAAGTPACVAVYDGLAALPSGTERLVAEGAPASIFCTLPWYRNFASNAIGPDDKVRVYAAHRADQAEPAAMLFMRASAAGRRMPPARALHALTSYYSSLTAPLCDAADADFAGLQAIAEHIAAERPRWDVVDIEPLDVDHPHFGALETAFRRSGYLVDRYFCFGNWYLEVGGASFKDYFAKRPTKLAKNAPRSRRKLEASGRMRLDIVTSRSGLEEAKAAYHTIYRSSWKKSEPFPQFIDGLADVAADLGWLRLGVIHIDGIPAAAQIWFVTGDTASIFKVAYDSRFAKESVGTVLSCYLMEHVIDVDKVRIVDYLTGDDAYKSEWMSHRRERWGIVAYSPRTPRGLIAAARHFGGRAWRRLRPPAKPAAQADAKQAPGAVTHPT